MRVDNDLPHGLLAQTNYQDQSPQSNQSGDIFTIDSLLRKDSGSIIDEAAQVTPANFNVIKNPGFNFKSLQGSNQKMEKSNHFSNKEESMSLANSPKVETFDINNY